MSSEQSQKIGVLTATIVGMNAMIGAGIFTIPSSLASNVGAGAIATFAFVGFAIWCMAQSIGRVAQLYPQEGSFYVYAKQWGGHTVGILAAACYLIGLVIGMGLLTHAAGDYLAHYMPSSDPKMLGVFCLAALTFLNMFGVSLSTFSQQILIVLTIFPIIATTFLCLTKAQVKNLFPFVPHGVASIFQETRRLAFAFFGFEAVASLFSIVRDPQRNVPRAISYSLLGVALLYFGFIVSIIMAVPVEFFGDPNAPVSGALLRVFPQQGWIIESIHLSCLFAILGTLHSMVWASGMLFLSFFKKLRCTTIQKLLASGIMSQKMATLCIGVAIFASFSLLTNNLFFNFTALFLLTAYIAAMLPLLFLKEEWKSGQNSITVLGIMTGLLMFYFAADNSKEYFRSKLCSAAALVCRR